MDAWTREVRVSAFGRWQMLGSVLWSQHPPWPTGPSAMKLTPAGVGGVPPSLWFDCGLRELLSEDSLCPCICRAELRAALPQRPGLPACILDLLHTWGHTGTTWSWPRGPLGWLCYRWGSHVASTGVVGVAPRRWGVLSRTEEG